MTNKKVTRERRQADGEETELEIAMKTYGSQLRYECGLARKFYDPEAESEYTGIDDKRSCFKEPKIECLMNFSLIRM